MEEITGKESNLTPNQYEYIKTEIGVEKSSASGFPLSLKIEYKATGKEKVTFNGFMEYFGSNDQLLMEMFALTGTDSSIFSNETTSKSLSFKNTITQMIKVAAASPTITNVLSLSDETNTYAISWTGLMNGKDRTISSNDVWTASQNDKTRMSLKYDISLTFSEDFDVATTVNFNDMKTEGDPEFTGKLSISLKNVEWKLGDRFVFTGSAKIDIDYTNETVKSRCLGC